MNKNEEIVRRHLKHLAEMEKFKKERYLIEFEKMQNGEFFRKLKTEIFTDYEFLEDNGIIHIYYDNNSTRNSINSVSLYFKKINDTLCEEVLTHTIFERTDDNNFYNDETGLAFNFNTGFEKAVGMKIDSVYLVNTNEYFNHYRKLQKEDIKITSKYHYLLLKKRLNFTK